MNYDGLDSARVADEIADVFALLTAFTASGTDERVLEIAEAVEVASQDHQFRRLTAAFDFLASVHKRGGDRSEVAEAEVRMTEAYANLRAEG